MHSERRQHQPKQLRRQDAARRTELPLGAHVSGTAPVHRSRVMEAMDSSDFMLAHARSMAFSTCAQAPLFGCPSSSQCPATTTTAAYCP